MRSGVAVIALFAILIVALVCGCGLKPVAPVVSLEEANNMFDAAKFTGAATKSPYEFFSAEIFLKKAADEMNLGNDGKAAIYLNKGYAQAKKAYENAKRHQRAN